MNTKLNVMCRICHKEHVIEANTDGLYWLKHGELIQDALPELSAEERELLISGICGACFDEMFGKECCS